MEIVIKKLTPELASDYLHFFDVTPHDDYSDKTGNSRCYCVGWCAADHRVKADWSTADKRRLLAEQYVQNGYLKGYLAYEGKKVIGWCNANDRKACVNSIGWLLFMKKIDTENDKLKVKSIFCFVIAPEAQRMGVATKLLECVCQDAEKDGYDVVEAYPNKEFSDTAHEFTGPAEMYRKAGFVYACDKDDNSVVVRKMLK